MEPPDLPRLILPDRAIESLKWLALIFMTGDHINKYLLNGTQIWLYDIGRSAMPLFVGVLAYNLSRPNHSAHKVYKRTMLRLLLGGVTATPAFVALDGLAAGWWPFNIMFALAAIAAMLFLSDRRDGIGLVGAGAIFLFAGAVVEFCWPALALGIAVWSYCKRPSWGAAALLILSLTLLRFVNGNLWAFGVVPVVVSTALMNLSMPRLWWFFYLYYPVI